MGSKRRTDLANGLRLWATCEKTQAEAIDRGLTAFVSSQKQTIDELKSVETSIRELEAKRLVATRQLLTSWYSMTESVLGDVKTASTNDLVFWNRLIKASPETYEFLQPRWERFECLLVSSQVRDYQKKERTEKVAKLLSETDNMKLSTSTHTGEQDEEGKKREGPGPR